MAFQKFFTSVEPLFQKNGKYEKLYPVFEMVETIFYTKLRFMDVKEIARCDSAIYPKSSFNMLV